MNNDLHINNKDTIKHFFTAVAAGVRGEIVDIAAFLTDDVTWHLPQSTAQMGKAFYDGKADVMTMFSGAVAQFYQPESMQFTYHSFIADGDFAHCHFSLSAITSTGKPYLNQYQSLFRLHDGKIAEVWEYFDTAYLFSVFAA